MHVLSSYYMPGSSVVSGDPDVNIIRSILITHDSVFINLLPHCSLFVKKTPQVHSHRAFMVICWHAQTGKIWVHIPPRSNEKTALILWASVSISHFSQFCSFSLGGEWFCSLKWSPSTVLKCFLVFPKHLSTRCPWCAFWRKYVP